MLLFYAVVSVLRSHEEARRVVGFVIGIGAVLGVLGVVERLTSFNPFEHLDSVVPLLRHAAGGSYMLVRAGGIRASGSSVHPIAFATTLGIIISLALARLTVARDSLPRQPCTLGLPASWGLRWFSQAPAPHS